MANRRGSDHENAGLRIIEIREDSVCSTVLQISAPQSNSQPQFCCRRYPPIPTPPVCVEARFFEGDDFFGHQTRQHIGEIINWEAAGHWQAMWYISTMYLMVVTTALSTYYLPRLSEITNKVELRKELIGGYRIIMPIVIVMSFVIFLLKDLIIWLLFTEDFNSMRELFMWQLIGDVFKLAAWLLAYLMLAKAMTKTYILTEIIFSITFVLLSVFCVNQYGLIGMSYSFALNYLLYLIVMIMITKKEWS